MFWQPLRVKGNQEVDDDDGLVLQLPLDGARGRRLSSSLRLTKSQVEETLVVVLQNISECLALFVSQNPLKLIQLNDWRKQKQTTLLQGDGSTADLEL